MTHAVNQIETPPFSPSLVARLRSAQHPRPLAPDALIATLAEAARQWQQPHYPRRRQAVEGLAALTGLAPAMIDEGFDHHFADYTPDGLGRLRDEAMAQAGPGGRGPALCLLVVAGNVPGLAVPDLAAVLLAGSACLVRPSSHDPFTPWLFAETLIELEPRLAGLIAVVRWLRDDAAVSAAAASAADCVVASGDDGTIGAIAPHARRLIGYGHRRSVALIGAEALAEADDLANRLARDICWYEQQGCLSPHVAYVEEGGPITAHDFATRLASALDDYAQRWPPAPIPLEAAGAIMQLRAEMEFCTNGACALALTNGAVLYDPDPTPRPSPGYRTIWVKPIDRLERAIDSLNEWNGRIESAGLALPAERAALVREQLGALGASRCGPVGEMQEPPLRWRWLDQGLLAQLFQWNDTRTARTS